MPTPPAPGPTPPAPGPTPPAPGPTPAAPGPTPPAPSARPPRSLAQKLGLNPGDRACVLGAPAPLADCLGPVDPTVRWPEAPEVVGWALLYAPDVAALEAGWPKLRARLAAGGLAWVAYPKKSGPLRSDLDRDHGWAILTAEDWHPVTQIALDPTWSALRFRPRAEIKVMTRKF